ncbi:diguanylate cyclase domain-containing protein [Sulfitobacter sp.]|uniref:diguanylate cyclase domain-containing protein n=1 Tax=Sulfitobacter sp. TaxID=1903071 RepID=UPI0035626B9C
MSHQHAFPVPNQPPAPRHFRGPLFLMAFVVAATLLTAAFWVTVRLDQVASKGARVVTEAVLQETVNRLRSMTQDYAFWSFSYELVQEGDAGAIFEHIGSGAAQSDLFDQLFILSPDFELLHEFHSDGETFPDFATLQPALEGSLKTLKDLPPAQYQSVSGYAELDGAFFAVTSAWITPDYIETLGTRAVPVLVGIVHLDPGWTKSLSNLSLQSGFSFEKEVPSSATLENGTVLTNPDDQPVGYLVWDSPVAGKMLRQQIMPAILIVCASIVLACFGAARFFDGQHRAVQKAMQIATTDQLTGVLNRAGLHQVFEGEQTTAAIADGRVAVIYIDMNGLKRLNDAYGHAVGDSALTVLAQTLESSIRQGDVVARLGGDEFVCIIFDQDPGQSAIQVATRILRLTDRPFATSIPDRKLELSIGIAVATPDIQWDALLRQADAAMYWGKQRGERNAAYFATRLKHLPYLPVSTMQQASRDMNA